MAKRGAGEIAPEGIEEGGRAVVSEEKFARGRSVEESVLIGEKGCCSLEEPEGLHRG